jgi:hypothetical protein
MCKHDDNQNSCKQWNWTEKRFRKIYPREIKLKKKGHTVGTLPNSNQQQKRRNSQNGYP